MGWVLSTRVNVAPAQYAVGPIRPRLWPWVFFPYRSFTPRVTHHVSYPFLSVSLFALSRAFFLPSRLFASGRPSPFFPSPWGFGFPEALIRKGKDGKERIDVLLSRILCIPYFSIKPNQNVTTVGSTPTKKLCQGHC